MNAIRPKIGPFQRSICSDSLEATLADTRDPASIKSAELRLD